MELTVPQRSPEWFRLRADLCLTASRFGEALGIGRGKPYDFLISLLMADDEMYKSVPTKETMHGVDKEPLIDEAYQVLSGYTTKESGLWIPGEGHELFGLIGASPDAKVYDKDNNFIGLAEYKAPVYQLYTPKRHPPFGVPRTYMAQMHAQMSVAGFPWCDFLAICTATEDIMLQRVHFNHTYWKAVSDELMEFCLVFKHARDRFRKSGGDLEYSLDFADVKKIRKKELHNHYYPGEDKIKVVNMVTKDSQGQFVTSHGAFPYDFLMGEDLMPDDLLEGL